jgi:uncharacterized protein (TIGR02246 family)
MYRPSVTSPSQSATFVDVESVIRGLTQDYCTAFNTGNYDQVAALYASNGVYMAPHRESAQGPRAIESRLRNLGETGYSDLRFETQRVDASGDMAVEIGRYTLAIRLENGSSLADRGKYLHVWRRLGAWLLLANAWNSDMPPVK